MSRALSGATDRRMQVMQLAGTGAGYGGGRAGTVPRQKKSCFPVRNTAFYSCAVRYR